MCYSGTHKYMQQQLSIFSPVWDQKIKSSKIQRTEKQGRWGHFHRMPRQP